MKLGMVGMPFSGKTTVFNAVSGAHGEVGSYHHGEEVYHAVVNVPDPRLQRLAEIGGPRVVKPATMEYIDVPGVMADKGSEEYLQRLAVLRETDALVHVVRHFECSSAPHPRGSLDPVRDARELYDELVIADLAIVERRLEKLAKQAHREKGHEKEQELLARCKETLETGRPVSSIEMIRRDRARLSNFAFLTMKPILFVLNVGEGLLGKKEAEQKAEETAGAVAGVTGETMVMCGELEMEIAELDPGDRKEFLQGLGIGEPVSSRLIRTSYRVLGLRSFFTGIDDELRAWTVAAGDDAVTAAGKVHSEMAKGFIRAEVVHFSDLDRAGSLKAARDEGKLRLEGRDYQVRDGDVITFRFSV